MPDPVRPAVEADIPTLVDLMQQFYAEAHYPLDRSWAAASFSMLLGNPALGAVWILGRTEAAGYVVLSVRFSMEHGGLEGIIDDLFVRPGFRRQGLAREGLAALVGECRTRQVRAVQVEVDEQNTPAQALYRRLGLTPRSDRRQILTAAAAALNCTS